MKSNILSALMVLTTSCVVCHGLYLYPYGPTANDNRLMQGANPAVTITSDAKYYFYGNGYDHLCLSDNGFVSFGGPVSSNKPKQFPVTEGAQSIQIASFLAVYWSDVDTRCDGGNIYYRTTQDPTLLDELHDHIMMSGSGSSFSPKEALILTWEDVSSSLDVTCDSSNKRNTPDAILRNSFQLALVTDDLSTTYAIFRYDKLEWHTYTSQDGSIVRGPATAGGNAGDKTNGFNLNSLMADPKDIVYLTLQSNVGYGGVFVYRVDLGPSMEAQVRLMANMMLFAQTAETAEVAEDELYVPFKEIIYSSNTQSGTHTASFGTKLRYNDYGARRPSRPYVQRARAEDVDALSHELQRIKY